MATAGKPDGMSMHRTPRTWPAAELVYNAGGLSLAGQEADNGNGHRAF